MEDSSRARPWGFHSDLQPQERCLGPDQGCVCLLGSVCGNNLFQMLNLALPGVAEHFATSFGVLVSQAKGQCVLTAVMRA